ncbi:MAG: hypothetical protein LBH36_01140 [Candidatus Nomurabacteria bacterium]|jgi:hypothetical protein|nr:hypothetical protein [Candidatus Nomurabacteria bacterium]
MNEQQSGVVGTEQSNPLITDPYAARTQPIIEADAEYKHAVACEFANKLALEHRCALLHKVFIIEFSVMVMVLIAFVIAIFSSDYNWLITTRTLFMTSWVAIAITAIVQAIFTAHHKSKDSGMIK